MKITVTGAGGRIGGRLVERLRDRGDEVTTLSRNPSSPGAVRWMPEQEPAPAAALSGRDAVIHLAGEDVAQRWSDDAKRRIRSSRELGTRNLVAGIAAAEQRPRALVSASAVGYYGPHGSEELDERSPAGDDFLADVCVIWEGEAERATEHGLRVVTVRTGVVLDQGGGALAKMLPFFKLGIGGPVAGGDQYLPWIHVDDVVGIYLAALDGDDWTGPVNATAPDPRDQQGVREGARPRAAPPGLRPGARPSRQDALRPDGGDRHHGQRVIPRRAQEFGYAFAHADLDEALRAALELTTSRSRSRRARRPSLAGHLGLARLLAPLPRLAIVPLGGLVPRRDRRAR